MVQGKFIASQWNYGTHVVWNYGGMDQESRWLTRYNEVKEFIELEHRNPSKYRIEEHDMLNWLKANRKAMNAGKMKAERERPPLGLPEERRMEKPPSRSPRGEKDERPPLGPRRPPLIPLFRAKVEPRPVGRGFCFMEFVENNCAEWWEFGN